MLCTQWNVRNSYPSSIMSQKVIKQKKGNASTTCLFKEIAYIQSLSYIDPSTSNTKHTSFERSNTDIPPSFCEDFSKRSLAQAKMSYIVRYSSNPINNASVCVSFSLLELFSLSSIFILFLIFTSDEWVNIPFLL